ncbi:hypothetical protein J588_2830 [Acinetobacter sp. 1578804]|nr:hypothetical protein J588_2830 [Acinetobacter sp. 1578804]EXG30984.1 hypothetical protein J733_2436 [Acinetobacter sp. 263903-2]EXR39791.1 hypothetical protein J655_3040 [Acinetobacter sp. 1294243]EXS00535.1 hypothetical protein J687_1948 [Acinetobacter sp. 225588]EYT45706.1 hypothetical protein J619_01869 [Acinetobacter sp. 478810]KCX96768.1 hypothetical protein J584_2588 [Acinetobacter sp. 72431]KCY67273.1 hypothetical protein J608_1789 [Acinetobacter baumannii 1288284]
MQQNRIEDESGQVLQMTMPLLTLGKTKVTEWAVGKKF